MQEEQSLIRKVQKHGNHAAADALVRKYYDEIFKFIRKQIQNEMIADKICEYVGQLPPDIQKIFRLHIWGEYTFKEIAETMALSESSVKSKYYRLIHLLRKEFSLYGQ